MEPNILIGSMFVMEHCETLDVLIPVFNEDACLDELFRRLNFLRERLVDVRVRCIFVNDGSCDGTADKLSAYAADFPWISAIHFSRNFGHQMAVTAGLDRADADYVAIIDAYLQDPPEIIAEMLAKAREGFDVVYGQRLSRKGETWFKRLTASLFYRFISRMCDTEIPKDAGDFRLISRRVHSALKGMREQHRFLRGMVPWVGFRSTPFHYHRDERYAGETKYPFRKMCRFALDAIFSFSNTPLRLATYSGLGILLLGVLGGLLLLYFRLFTTFYVPGIAATILTVIIIGGIQIIMLGIIGEYIGRIFAESKNRPLYIIAATQNLEQAATERMRNGLEAS